MTSDRIYRKALPFEAVQKEVRRCTDTQFDPGIAEVFCKVPEKTWQELRLRVEEKQVNRTP
jgi:HD-GYP domain-containing protein (c-di-GMP phosphodiesterase class II)